MPLTGTGAVLGAAMSAAVGAPPSAAGLFQILGETLVNWSLVNIQVNAGAMAASGGSVSGFGNFTVLGSAAELGALFADALGIASTPPEARLVWVEVAEAVVDHFSNFGQANGSGLTSGTPCGGAGTVEWTSAVFLPPLATQISVTDAVAAALLELFGIALLDHIRSNASVVAASLTGAPLSAPTNGAVTGTGSII